MAFIIGMNSGSSFDGIDVVLCETEIEDDGFPKKPKFLCGSSYDWPDEVKKIVSDAFVNKVDMIGLNRLNYICGAVFAEKAAKFMKDHKIDPVDVAVIGVDTQTIYQEQPDHKRISEMSEDEKANWPGRWLSKAYPAGMQMGESSVIANLTNVDTVTHFRPADHVFGGSAAPLMPYLDFILFRKDEHPSMTLNIGGIANLHVGCSDRAKMFGFDTGPGNVISNYMMKKLFGRDYDQDGQVARSGQVNSDLLDYFMHHPFFDRPVPRSGWIADYGPAYIDGVLTRFSTLPKEDFIATACEFTGAAVGKSLTDNIPESIIRAVDKLYASGGGVKNPAIMAAIQKYVPENIKVTTSADIGIPPEFKEAIKFATIAYSTINDIPGNIPAAGHASHYAILGKIARAPRHIRGGAQFVRENPAR